MSRARWALLAAAALLALLLAAPPAAAANALVAPQAQDARSQPLNPDPRSVPHVVYGAECNAYMVGALREHPTSC